MTTVLDEVAPRGLIVGLTGRTCCGKTTAARYIESKYDAYKIHTMEVIRYIAERAGIEPTIENLHNIAVSERKRNGERYLSSLTCSKLSEDILALETKIIVVEGIESIYDMDEFQVFCEVHPYSFISLYIDTPVRDRFLWHNTKRQRLGLKPVNEIDFRRLDKRAYDKRLKKVYDCSMAEVKNGKDVPIDDFEYDIEIELSCFAPQHKPA